MTNFQDDEQEFIPTDEDHIMLDMMDMIDDGGLTVERPDFEYEDSSVDTSKLSKNDIKNMVTEHLQQIFDPEIPINIWEIGLIYNVDVNDNFDCKVTMTLTSPNCPTAESLPQMVQIGASLVPGVNDTEIELTFEPPWGIDKMSEDARMLLGLE